MEGIKLEREENGRNKVGKRREWNEEGWEEMRMEGIWLGKRRKWNGRNKIGKRREWKE